MMYEFCAKCSRKTVAITTESYYNGSHQRLRVGKWCKKCKIIYLNKEIKINEIKIVQIEPKFGWASASRISRSRKAHWFDKDSFVCICGKDKIFNGSAIKFIPENGLFKKQKCTICVRLLELRKEPMVSMVSA